MARLDEATTHVAAEMVRDTVVIRSKSQQTVAGLPVYYGGRPEFRGKVVQDDSGRAILVGALEQSVLPAMVNIVGALLAACLAMAGAALLVSGDLGGIAALGFAALTGLAVLAGALMIQRLSAIDEQTIKAALLAISEEKLPSTGR